MTLARTDEQRMLADTIAGAMATDGAKNWGVAEALGLALLGMPGSEGGLGTDLRDAAVVVEAFGEVNAALEFADHWCTASGAGDQARTVLHCAEMVGLCRTMIRDTALYLRDRKQFGVPIASFQALRHRMADMAMWLEQASALTDVAIDTLAEDNNAKRTVDAARVLVDDAARVIGEGAVQLHGAMGLTAELRVGGYFRRLRTLMQRDGGGRAALARYAATAA